MKDILPLMFWDLREQLSTCQVSLDALKSKTAQLQTVSTAPCTLARHSVDTKYIDTEQEILSQSLGNLLQTTEALKRNRASLKARLNRLVAIEAGSN